MAKKKTIKYLENGEYHDATVKDVGVIEELKTESKDNLVEAINEIFLGGGKGFSDLQQKVDESTQAAQNAQQATDNLQQAANNLQQRLEEVANSGLSDEEAQKIINQAVEDAKRAQAEALQAYKEAQKELDDSMAQFMEEQKAINKELEQAKADIQGDIDRKNAEIEQINAVIESTKSDLTATSARLASVRNDLTNAQMDWGKVRTEITNINGKLASKMSNTDFDKYKERIERNETEITQTKNELQSKATKQDLDVLTGTVTTQGSSITQLAGKIEQKVSKDTLANDIDDFQVKKANIFTGTREFMGWEFSDKALGRVNDDIYNHAKVAELHNGSNLSITVDGLEVGKTYSVSIFAKASANSNTSGVKVTVDNGKSYSGLMRTVYTPHDTKVTTNWQRYYATIVASATTMKFVFDRSGMTSNITMYLNRPKLEVGATVYAWEDNVQDIYKRVEHTEAQFDVYNDQISGIVKRQTETDKKIENVSSTFTQRADGIEANAKKYTNDKVTGLTEEFSGKLKATSQELSTEYEKQTNAKIGALADGGSNLILNSSFLVTDNNGNATLENWRDTSSKISLTKPNGLDGTWIRVNRATTGTTLGARSNYFPVKQGKLVVGVDVALDGTGNISPYVLRIEYYDVSNNRVNYEDITLQKLGLSASQITKSGSNFRYARGVYKTSNDRSDVAKACIVVPETITGYNMYLTNFFAKFSDVNDGTYEVNPLDQQASLIKQRTKIEQDSEKINLLNTQTEKLGNDIKATNTSVNVLKGEVDLKASQSTVNNLTNRVSKNEADIKVFPDKIKSEVREVSKKIDGVNDKVDGIQVGGTNLIPHSEVDTIRGNTDYWVFSTGNINNYGGRYNPTDKSLELEAHIKDTNYQFLQWQQQNNVLMNTELAHLQVGDVLTVSAEVYIQNPNMSGNITLGFRVNPRTNYNSYFSTERGIDLRNLKTGWQRVSATGTITQKYLDCIKDVQLIRILLAANGLKENNKIAFRKIKVEKGNIATDWSPAPEDTDESIELVKTVATQTKDGFERLTQKTGYNASTGEFSKVTTQINEGIKGVTTQVASVSNRLDNIKVGGTNLAKHTSNTLTNRMRVSEWVYIASSGNTSNFNLDNYKGQTLTMRAWIDKPTVDAHLQVWTNASNNAYAVGNTIKVGQSGYSSLTFNVPASFTTWNIPIGNGKSAELAYKEFKIEKGTIATDWSPAPEDTNSSIESAKSIATQTKDGFERLTQKTGYNASTGEFSKVTTQINEGIKGISSEVKSVSNRVDSVNGRLDNIKVGGTNLLRKTSNEWKTWTGTGWANNTVDNGSINLDAGTYTFRAEIDNTGNTQRGVHVEVYVNSENKFLDKIAKTYTQTFVNAGSKGYVTTTFTIDRSLTDARIHPHAAVNSPIPSTVTIKWRREKLEKGNVATDWSPAPEDLQAGIDVATTKATQTDTKFERMISQIQYNNSTGEIGKYEHKITELANGTQEKISAIRTDSDKKLQSATQTLTNKIGDLERTVRTNTTNIGQYRQEMTNSAKEWSTKFTSVQANLSNVNNKVDNIKVGGVNLMRNTTRDYVKFTGGGWGVDYLTPNHQAIDVATEGGRTYTFSAWVKNDKSSAGRIDLEIYQYNAKGENKENGSSSEVSVWASPGEEKRLVFTKTLLADTTRVRFHTRNRDNNGTVTYWTKMAQVEKGNIATDWSPAPEDTENEIQVLSGKITANSNEFSTVYSKITNVQDIANSTGGGINLAKHTSNKLANVTASPWLYVGSESSSSFNNLKDYQGKYMTVRVWIEKPSRDTWVQIWNDKQPIYGNTIKAGQSGYSTASGVIPKGITAWNIPVGNNNNGTTTTFGWKEFKIELGNVATPWSPNPDDVDNNIDTAANNARTNAKNDAVNAIKNDSQWQSMGKIVTNASFLQNSDGFAQEVSKRIVGSTGQTNLYYNSEFAYTGTDPHNMDGIQSTRNVAYSKNDRWANYKGSNAVFALTRGTLNDYYYIEHRKDKYVKVQPGEVVSASVVTWVTGGSDVPRDGYAICTISFYKDLNSSRMGYKETSVAAKDINYPHYRTLKVENVTVPNGANYMILHLIARGSSNWQFSQPMLVKDDHVGVYVPSTQLQLNDISSRTQFLQDNEKFLLRVTQVGGATKADVNSANSKIGDLTTRVKNTEVAITSGGVTINGNTTINGELEAKEIVMKATNGAKLKLNAQGLNMETYNGAQLNLGTDKMELISPYYSNYNPLSWRTVIDDKGLGITEAQFGYDNTLKYYNEIQGYVGPGYANRVDGDLPERINSGIEIGLMPFKAYGGDKQDKTKEIYGGDYIAIGEYHKDDKLMKKRKMNAGYVFLTYDDDVYDMKIFSDNDKPNPRQGNNLIGNTTFIPSGIEGGIAVTWTNWSDWTGKIPAVMRYDGPGKWLGCIAFGGDGNVVLSGGGKRWNLLGH